MLIGFPTLGIFEERPYKSLNFKAFIEFNPRAALISEKLIGPPIGNVIFINKLGNTWHCHMYLWAHKATLGIATCIYGLTRQHLALPHVSMGSQGNIWHCHMYLWAHKATLGIATCKAILFVLIYVL
jgi:hypothetical protein